MSFIEFMTQEEIVGFIDSEFDAEVQNFLGYRAGPLGCCYDNFVLLLTLEQLDRDLLQRYPLLVIKRQYIQQKIAQCASLPLPAFPLDTIDLELLRRGSL